MEGITGTSDGLVDLRSHSPLSANAAVFAMRTNVKRGLNRLFVVGCTLWFIFFLVGWPIISAVRGEREADKYETDGFAKLSAEQKGNPETMRDFRFLADAYRNGVRSRSGFAGHYSDIREQPLDMLVIFLIPPAIVYLVGWGIAALTSWVIIGFRSDAPN